MGVPPAVCSNPGAGRGSHPNAAGWNSLRDWGQWSNPTAGPAPNCHWFFFSSTIFTVCPLFWGLPSVSRRVWKQWKKFQFLKQWLNYSVPPSTPSLIHSSLLIFLQLLHMSQLFATFIICPVTSMHFNFTSKFPIVICIWEGLEASKS